MKTAQTAPIAIGDEYQGKRRNPTGCSPVVLLLILLGIASLSFAQTPAAPKPDTIFTNTQARAEALQIIQQAWVILGASVTPLKTDEAIALKKGLEGVYGLLSPPQPADKPKEPVKK